MSQTVRLRPLTLTAGQYGVLLAALEMYAEQADENGTYINGTGNARDMANRATEKVLAARKA